MKTAIARWFGDALYHTYPVWSVLLAYLSPFILLAIVVVGAFRRPEGDGITFIEAKRQ